MPEENTRPAGQDGDPMTPKDNLIPGVEYVIAVSSGKGGVGKSTVTTNLAVALTKAGKTVGLLDADVYGPNIPTMMGVTKPPAKEDAKIIPAEGHGVKVMSMGFFVPEETPVVWRGPMVHGAIQQFFRDVVWGDLDYLLIDLPPGTGDVQLSLSQLVPLTGAVTVTTPQEVALQDVRKGIVMFQKVNVPILGVIENMSFYVCGHCGERSEIFSHGGGEKAAEKFGVPFLGRIPLDPEIRRGGDEGTPIVIANPSSPQAKAFTDMAAALITRTARESSEGKASISSLLGKIKKPMQEEK
ncbi:MAG: Mrp/NBP35 family ATP-binding protein [Nitrospirales bacterium]|nr:Mrp/NBP35 family ATP-binding protein [Nitrospira sp.]MDR4503063.1 Mrp/NBP35 family ATP-binding protein [Nitrospirales bacterium]